MASTTAARSETDTTTYQAARTQLIGWGALIVAIYVVFLLIFPLIPTIYHSEQVLEIEAMLRDGRRWFAPLYALGLGALFYAYWRALHIVHTFSNEDPESAKSLRIWILGIGLLCGIVLIGLYPITALDVVLYVVRSRLWGLYGGNPMTAVPDSFPQDPYIQFAGEYTDEVSPYGPLWELIAQIPIQLGVLDIAGGIIAMKVISLISYISMALLVGWYARQDEPYYGVNGLTALTFFALNPMILLEAIGNGHNDMLMLALMTLGLVLWQRDRWSLAAFAFTLAALIKITGLILLPLFAVAVLAAAPNWQTRITRGAGIAVIFLLTAGIAYRIMGPFPDVFAGAQHAMFGRSGYTPIYAIRVVVRETYARGGGFNAALTYLIRGTFVVYFAYLVLRLARRKITLIQAGYLAYFSLLLLGSTFRIWYPMWLVPFAALRLTSRTYWRTFLFSLTAEFSVLMYLLVWRWKLRDWEWGKNGPLKPFWNAWDITSLITVPWVFGIPLLGPILRRWRDPKRFDRSLWI